MPQNARFTYKAAALEILRKHRRPLTPKEIVEKAILAGLIKKSGYTPDATLASKLYVDIRDNAESAFRKVGRGQFALRIKKNTSKTRN